MMIIRKTTINDVNTIVNSERLVAFRTFQLAVYATVESCAEALAVRNNHQLNIFVYDNETA